MLTGDIHSQSSDAIITPWQKENSGKGAGQRKRLQLFRNEDGTVRVQIISESNSNKIAQFFKSNKINTPSSSQNNKNTIIESRQFTNISKELFDKEKEAIENLLEKDKQLKKQTSLKELLEIIEKSFKKLNHLELNATPPSSSDIDQAAKEIQEENLKQNEDLQAIRKTLTEENTLQQEITSLAGHLNSFSQEVKEKWEKLVEDSQSFDNKKSSTSEIELHNKKLSEQIAELGTLCNQELQTKIDDSIELLENHFDSSPELPSNKKEAFSAVKDQVLNQRKQAWVSLRSNAETAGKDLKTLATLMQQAIKEQPIEKSLINALDLNVSEKGFFGSFSSFIPSFLKWSEKSPFTQNSEFFDEAALLYVNHLIQKIKETSTSLLNNLPSTHQEEKKNLLKSYDVLWNSEKLLKSELEAFVQDLILCFEKESLGEKNEDESFDVQSALKNLKGQKEALSLILTEGQQQHLVEKIKEVHPKSFSHEAPGALLRWAQTATEHLQTRTPNPNIRNLSADWQNLRSSASQTLESLKNLEALAVCKEEYENIAEAFEKDLSKLTGQEKEKAKVALRDLHLTLQSFEEVTKLEAIPSSAVTAYKSRLIQAKNTFDSILNVEKQKKKLLASLDEEIDTFIHFLKNFDTPLSELEKYFSVELSEFRKFLNNLENAMQEKKRIGVAPGTSYTPQFLRDLFTSASVFKNKTLHSVVPYLPSFLYKESLKSLISPSPFPSSSETTIEVQDLSLSELADYKETIKYEIAIQKNILFSHQAVEAVQALKDYQEQSQILKKGIENLTSGIKGIKQNDSFFKPSEGLAETTPSTLQFYTAVVATKSLQEFEIEQKKAIAKEPNPLFIVQKLTGDTLKLKRDIDGLEKRTNLTLLDQIGKLKNNPPYQKAAKLAFSQMMTAKLLKHTQEMTSQLGDFKKYPEMEKEAIRLAEMAKNNLLKELISAPKEIQEHAKQWIPILHAKSTTNQLSAKSSVNFDALPLFELKKYARLIDHAVKTGTDHMALIKQTHAKFERASNMLKLKKSEANQFIKELHIKDQVLAKNRMENILKVVEQQQLNDSNEKTEEWSLLSAIFGSSKNLSPSQAANQLLSNYSKKIGDYCSHIESEIKKIRNMRELTIPQQLATQPDEKLVEELRQRFQDNYVPKVKKIRDELQLYYSKLSLILGSYLPEKSRLYTEIENSLKENLKVLDKYEQGYQAPGLINSFYGFTPFSKFTPIQMEQYASHIERIKKTWKNGNSDGDKFSFFDDKFSIQELVQAQVKYEDTKNMQVRTQAKILRDSDRFDEAFLFETEIKEITDREEKAWRGKVRDIETLRKLPAALLKYKTEIKFKIENYSVDKNPPSYEVQMFKLLNLKEHAPLGFKITQSEATQSKNERIDEEIKTLQGKMGAKIYKKCKEYRNNLKELRNNIDDIYETFPSFHAIQKETVIRAIEQELNEFDLSGKKFETRSNTQTLSYLYNPKKTVEEMTPEEIVRLKPERKTEELIFKSNKKIQDNFNIQQISKPYLDYKKNLKQAEKAKEDLYNADQLEYVDELEQEINKIKYSFAKKAKEDIKDQNALQALAADMQNLALRLKHHENIIGSKPPKSLQKQTLDPKSPHYNEFLEKRGRSLQEKISEKLTGADEYVEVLDRLVETLKMPKEWMQSVKKELETCKHDLKQLVYKDKAQKGWWGNSTKEFHISNFSEKELNEIANEISINDPLKKLVDTYQLKSIKTEMVYNVDLLKSIEDLKMKLNKKDSENAGDQISRLDELLDANLKEFKNYFEKSQNRLNEEKPILTLSMAMGALSDFIARSTRNLSENIEHIKQTLPTPQSQRLLSEIDPSKIETGYKELHQKIHSKLEKLQIRVKQYKKKIGPIQQKIKDITGGKAGFSGKWQNSFNEEMRCKKSFLDNCIQNNGQKQELALPKIQNGTLIWTPYSNLNKNHRDVRQTIFEFEKLINQLCEKNEEKTSITEKFEQQIRLNDIEKYIDNYEKLKNTLEKELKNSGLKIDKKSKIKATIEANEKRVCYAFNSLDNIGDSKWLCDTLYLAQCSMLAVITHLQNSYNNNAELVLHDPWVKLYWAEKNEKKNNKDQESLDQIKKEASDKIKTDLFTLNFKSNDSTIFGSKDNPDLSVKGIRERREQYLRDLVEITKKQEEKKLDLISANFDSEMSCMKKLKKTVDIELPNLKVDLTKLGDYATIKNSSDIEIKDTQDINTFDDLLQYSILIDSTFSKAIDCENKIFNEEILFWNEQIDSLNPYKKVSIKIDSIDDDEEFVEDDFNQDTQSNEIIIEEKNDIENKNNLAELSKNEKFIDFIQQFKITGLKKNKESVINSIKSRAEKIKIPSSNNNQIINSSIEKTTEILIDFYYKKIELSTKKHSIENTSDIHKDLESFELNFNNLVVQTFAILTQVSNALNLMFEHKISNDVLNENIVDGWLKTLLEKLEGIEKKSEKELKELNLDLIKCQSECEMVQETYLENILTISKNEVITSSNLQPIPSIKLKKSSSNEPFVTMKNRVLKNLSNEYINALGNIEKFKKELKCEFPIEISKYILNEICIDTNSDEENLKKVNINSILLKDNEKEFLQQKNQIKNFLENLNKKYNYYNENLNSLNKYKDLKSTEKKLESLKKTNPKSYFIIDAITVSIKKTKEAFDNIELDNQRNKELLFERIQTFKDNFDSLEKIILNIDTLKKLNPIDQLKQDKNQPGFLNHISRKSISSKIETVYKKKIDEAIIKLEKYKKCKFFVNENHKKLDINQKIFDIINEKIEKLEKLKNVNIEKLSVFDIQKWTIEIKNLTTENNLFMNEVTSLPFHALEFQAFFSLLEKVSKKVTMLGNEKIETFNERKQKILLSLETQLTKLNQDTITDFWKELKNLNSRLIQLLTEMKYDKSNIETVFNKISQFESINKFPFEISNMTALFLNKEFEKLFKWEENSKMFSNLSKDVDLLIEENKNKVEEWLDSEKIHSNNKINLERLSKTKSENEIKNIKQKLYNAEKKYQLSLKNLLENIHEMTLSAFWNQFYINYNDFQKIKNECFKDIQDEDMLSNQKRKNEKRENMRNHNKGTK